MSCSSGVLSKCARIWGYKPWRSMVDKHGNVQAMRPYHQACSRAARADYTGLGHSLTVTGTDIDMIDNGGFNLPTSAAELTALGYQPAARFESWFTESTYAFSFMPDYWGAWMSAPRYSELPRWEAMYGDPIVWGAQVPKVNLWQGASGTTMQAELEGRYGQYGAEVVVLNPVWSGTQANGTTVDSIDHFKPPCVTNSTAPDRAHRWAAPEAGTYAISTSGSSFDTVLYAYSGASVIACNDDWGGNTTSRITVTVSAGQNVTFLVDGYAAQSGSYALNIQKL
ncbi:MAG: ADYC domain-containing protein [Polyangiaceae bacterium]